jgi:integral membrane sensor domain MASE1
VRSGRPPAWESWCCTWADCAGGPGSIGDLLGTLVDVPGDRQPLGIALTDTAGHLARAVVAVLILQRLVGRRAVMDRLEQVGAVFVAIALGEALAATVAVLARWAGGILAVSEMGVFWRSWWLGGVAGGLVVVPLALAWSHPRALVWRRRRAGEAALMLAAVAGLSVIALSAEQPLTYMVFRRSSGPHCASARRERPWRSWSRR